MHRTAGSQHLAVRADVVAASLVPVEVRAREGAVVAVALVAHRDVRRDLLVLDQPTKEPARAVGGVRCKPLRLEIEALLGPVDHGLGCLDLVVGPGRRRLYVDDDRVLNIDQIVEPVAELHALVGLGRPGR